MTIPVRSSLRWALRTQCSPPGEVGLQLALKCRTQQGFHQVFESRRALGLYGAGYPSRKPWSPKQMNPQHAF